MHIVLFKAIKKQLGGHTHIAIFVRWQDGGDTWQKSGDLVIDNEQWDRTKKRLLMFVDELEEKDG